MKALADPTRLKPIDKKDGLLQVIVETPAGSRNKFAFDPEQEIFTLKKVLPAGMVFPWDFGFLPQTIAPDGDPIDVLLLMDEPAVPGIAVRARRWDAWGWRDSRWCCGGCCRGRAGGWRFRQRRLSGGRWRGACGSCAACGCLGIRGGR